MNLTSIYVHLEPDIDEIRYVGKADDPEDRFKDHLTDKRPSRKRCWIQSLLARGLKPRLEVLCEVPVEEWKFWERFYIKYFRELGFDLVNLTEGGDGASWPGETNPMWGKTGDKNPNTGRVKSPEERARISAALTGVPKSPEHRKKLSDANTGKVMPPEQRDKISVSLTGLMAGEKHPMFNRTHSPETREKMSAAHSGQNHHLFGVTGPDHPAFGRKHTEETKAKMRKPRTLETREKMRQAWVRRRAKE